MISLVVHAISELTPPHAKSAHARSSPMPEAGAVLWWPQNRVNAVVTMRV